MVRAEGLVLWAAPLAEGDDEGGGARDRIENHHSYQGYDSHGRNLHLKNKLGINSYRK